ncbi:MAG TPA: chemotaxis-specific protein-glutamate methyltransferase CheB [Polyangiaceae bacterium]|nr:chemotaxis-specific protein-glutamate methyltransferase CheB [Polyangiaceae bacterium]
MSIRVLVAEDSATARALLVSILESDSELEVIGQAKNGHEAVALAKRLLPDVITMDIHMPGLGGFEAIRRIRHDAPAPIVVVSASISKVDVAASLAALNAGALTALAKPAGPQAPNFEECARQLILTVKGMSEVKVVRRWSSVPARSAPRAIARPSKLLAIAASTGGPAALYRIFSALPAKFPVPIVVVQHISHGFLPGMIEWWRSASALDMRVASSGEVLQPGTVYVAPDSAHCQLSNRNTIVLSSAPPVDGHRPSASVLFRSAAQVHGTGLFALILTGMGRDGVDGLREVHARGGYVVAQDRESSVVFGMPGAAIEAGVVDDIVPLPAIADHLMQLLITPTSREIR